MKIKVCDICGSDLHEYRNGPVIIPSRPHFLTGRSNGPDILGHEFTADVVEVGEGVAQFRPGDRITSSSFIYCGKCHYCRNHSSRLLSLLKILVTDRTESFSVNDRFSRRPINKYWSNVLFDRG